MHRPTGKTAALTWWQSESRPVMRQKEIPFTTSAFISAPEKRPARSNRQEPPANSIKALLSWTGKIPSVSIDPGKTAMQDYPSFRTIVEPARSTHTIELHHTLFCAGSCFAENIGSMLISLHADICMNPTGVLYNPFSVCGMIRRIIAGKRYDGNELFESGGFWRSFDHHTRFCEPDKTKCLQAINTAFESARTAIRKTDFCLLTFGTAFVYKIKDRKRIVANCHKLPHNRFERILLTPQEIFEQCCTTFDMLIHIRPDIRIIITISPVRHLRDNPHENCISKSHLFAALHELEKKYGNLSYFPAYEIMMDELRDYRFYEADMTHPNETAVAYIQSRFQKAFLSDRFNNYIRSFTPVLKAVQHRFHTISSEAIAGFATSQLNAIRELEQQYPEIDFSREKEHFKSLCQQ
ncbi:MAG: GSCFA domain protein [Chitinivibrionales bacterium]|nr:GSCFA domain protein [Chitinivibrionales bacterium]